MVCPVPPDDDFNVGFIVLFIVAGLFGLANAFSVTHKAKTAERTAVVEQEPVK